MSDPASQAAIRAAGAGEDARWRVMPRFGPWLWGFFALAQGGLALMYLTVSPDPAAFQLIMYPILAGLGVSMCVWSTSWTAAGPAGLRIRSGWSTREIPWKQIAAVESSRMWGFRLTTRAGARRAMPGVNQSRVGLLLHLWEHHRGPAEPQQAMGTRGRQGWWAAEPQRYLGARIGVAVLLMLVVLVMMLVILLSSISLWITVPITAVLLIAVFAALIWVMFAGTVIESDGVKVRTPRGSRRVLWADVHQVVVAGSEVAVVTSNGLVTLVGVPAGEAGTIERFRAGSPAPR